jgi:trimethylamine--corrinoid protein Co-methyltransferase
MAERGASERRARRRAEQTLAVPQPKWRQVRIPFAPLELLDAEGLVRIETTALRVLEELRLEFMSEEAVAILEKHVAKIVDRSTGLVRLGREVVKEYVAKAPPTFTLYARNPERNLLVGANSINFLPVGGAPNVSDLDRGRRAGTFADQVALPKLSNASIACTQLVVCKSRRRTFPC